MMEATEAKTLATRYLEQLDALDHHRPLAAEASDSSLEAAYLVQAEFQSLLTGRGDQLVGYKVALTSKAMQEFCGVDQPLSGAVYERVVVESPTTVTLADHCHLGVEFEVAVVLRADLPAGSEPHTRDSIRESIATCHPAFELVEDRNADYGELNVFDLVSENAWNAGVVLGAGVSAWHGVDLESARTRLQTNGVDIGEGKTGDALGHPLEAVAWLANHLNDRGLMLKQGHLVMTGSSIVTQFPAVGDELHFTIDGLGEVRLSCI
ncbi:MAG: 2-keto-4-pentenoate hydratase [Acidimicrobiales bacterium]|jgi:2-keto-4-pentenoate hydratase